MFTINESGILTEYIPDTTTEEPVSLDIPENVVSIDCSLPVDELIIHVRGSSPNYIIPSFNVRQESIRSVTFDLSDYDDGVKYRWDDLSKDIDFGDDSFTDFCNMVPNFKILNIVGGMCKLDHTGRIKPRKPFLVIVHDVGAKFHCPTPIHDDPRIDVLYPDCWTDNFIGNYQRYKDFMSKKELDWLVGTIRKRASVLFFISNYRSSCINKEFVRFALQLGVVPSERVYEKLFDLVSEDPEMDMFLMSYKAKHYPPEKLAKRDEKRALNLLMHPDSASFISKYWKYEKMDDGYKIIGFRGEVLPDFELSTITDHTGKSRTLHIPRTISGKPVVFVESLWNSLLTDNSFCLEGIDVPDTVRGFGNRAFKDINATFINIPDGIKQIPESFAQGNSYLSECIVPDSVTEIGQYAFHNCTCLREVKFGKNVAKLCYASFEACLSLKSISLPPDVIIESSVFANSGISHIDYTSILHIGEYAFSGAPMMNAMLFQNNTQKIGFWKLPAHLFSDSQIQELILPDQTVCLANGVADGCNDLSYVNLNRCVSLEDCCFANTRNLKCIKMSPFLAEIGTWAFYHSGISELTLPDSIQSVGENAFSESCIQWIDLGSLRVVEYKTFTKCNSLSAVNAKNVKIINREAFSEILVPFTIFVGDPLEVIDPLAFDGSAEVTIVAPKDSVGKIVGMTKSMQNVKVVSSEDHFSSYMILAAETHLL